MSQPYRYDLIIFDCDGVLVDSEILAATELAAYITELGRATETAECLAAFTGISIAAVEDKLGSEWGVEVPDGFADALIARDRLAFADRLTAVPGAEKAVRTLKALGLPVCVASSGAPEKFTYTLTLTGLIGLFDGHLFSACEVAHGKPAPDLFLHAASQMGVDPARCMVVEDSAAGIQAARAAGMRAVGFAGGAHAGKGYVGMLMDAGADELILNLSALPTLVHESE